MEQPPDYSQYIQVISSTPMAVRLRPPMFIGSLNTKGLLNTIRWTFDFANQYLTWQHATIELRAENILHICFHHQQFVFEEKDGGYLHLDRLAEPVNWLSSDLLCLVGLTEFIEIQSGHQHFRYEKGEFIHLTTLSQPATDFTLTFRFDATIFGQALRPHCFVFRNFANNLVGRNWTKHITVIDQTTQQQYDYKASSPLDLFEQMVATTPVITAPIVVQIDEPTHQLHATIVFALAEKDEIIQSFLKDMADKCMGGTHHKGVVIGIENAINKITTTFFPDKEVYYISSNEYCRGLAVLILLDYEKVHFEGAVKHHIDNPELVTLLAQKIEEKLWEQQEEVKEMVRDAANKVWKIPTIK